MTMDTVSDPPTMFERIKESDVPHWQEAVANRLVIIPDGREYRVVFLSCVSQMGGKLVFRGKVIYGPGSRKECDRFIRTHS